MTTFDNNMENSKPMPPQVEYNVIGYKLKLIVDEVERQAMNDVSPLGITFSQGKAILYICEHGGECTQGDIEQFMDVSHQAASGVLSRLEQKGLVKCAFDGSDRRVKNVYITEEGSKLYEHCRDVRHLSDARIESSLTAEEKQEAFRILDKIYESLKDNSKQ